MEKLLEKNFPIDIIASWKFICSFVRYFILSLSLFLSQLLFFFWIICCLFISHYFEVSKDQRIEVEVNGVESIDLFSF